MTTIEILTPDEVKELSVEKLRSTLGNNVYAATIVIFEGLEAESRVTGNGHHMAQEVAGYAVKLLEKRLRNDKFGGIQ